MAYYKRKKTGKNSWLNISGSGLSYSTGKRHLRFTFGRGMWFNMNFLGFRFRKKLSGNNVYSASSYSSTNKHTRWFGMLISFLIPKPYRLVLPVGCFGLLCFLLGVVLLVMSGVMWYYKMNGAWYAFSAGLLFYLIWKVIVFKKYEVE